ncbi:MAG: hypothetical protein ACK6CT_13785 [Planctomycetia bacterium]
MTTDAPDSSRAWRRSLRRIAIGIVVLFVATLLWGLFGPEPPIGVARETTFLTAPLAADGLPDYEAGLLAMAGPAPAPEDNAAVELLQVMWPLGIDAKDLPVVCKALGIPDTPPADPLVEPTRDPAGKVSDEVFTATYTWPWTTAEHPYMAAWLLRHEAAIDRLVAAADRPRFWLPSPSLLDGAPAMLFEMSLESLQSLRSLSRFVLARALLHVGEGRHAAAWRDIRAVHRLGRLSVARESGPQTLIGLIFAIALMASADQITTRHLLGSPTLPPDVLATIRRELDAGPPLRESADALVFERLLGVDAVVWFARRVPGGRLARARAINNAIYGGSTGLSLASATSIDWNLVLQRLNTSYDDVEAALRLPTYAERRAALDRLTAPTASARSSSSGWRATGDTILGTCSRQYRSALIADTFESRLLPGVLGVDDATTRCRALMTLTRTAAALAARRADQPAGSPPYPERLDDLVPRYLPAVPIDPFPDKPLIYERRGDGYLLASVGQNGVFDGGDDMSGDIVGGEWQEQTRDVDYPKSDLVVRMPVPDRKPAVNSTP